MPDLEWELESSIGDRKITNSHISTLIGNRFKVSNAPFVITCSSNCETCFTIQASLIESLVLPNCESIPMPWMLAEKDDWVFWLNHEPAR